MKSVGNVIVVPLGLVDVVVEQVNGAFVVPTKIAGTDRLFAVVSPPSGGPGTPLFALAGGAIASAMTAAAAVEAARIRFNMIKPRVRGRTLVRMSPCDCLWRTTSGRARSRNPPQPPPTP